MTADEPLSLNLPEYAIDMIRRQTDGIADIIPGEREDDRVGFPVVAVLYLSARPVKELQQ